MVLTRISQVRVFVLFALCIIFATIAYGFAASNTVATSHAGSGSATISGYNVTNVHYTLATTNGSATNSSGISAVEFTLDNAVAASGTVRARLVTNGSWFTCATTNAPTNTIFSCGVTGVSVLDADNLEVVAGD